MSIKEWFINRFPATRKYNNRRFSEIEQSLSAMAEEQAELKRIILESSNRAYDKQDSIVSSVKKHERLLSELSKRITEVASTDKRIREDLSPLINLNEIRWTVDALKKGMQKSIEKPVLQLSYDVTEHCNLNCAGCDHFSPIADSSYTDVTEFQRDMERISKLFDGGIRYIHLVGGEPLLHPEIEVFMQTARNCFPYGKIKIITNGILLDQMSPGFWTTAKENEICIEVTPYPISIPVKDIMDKANNYGVCVEYFYRDGATLNDSCDPKNMLHMPLNIDGDGDAVSNWLGCYHANHCICVKHGKIYPCTICPNIEHFNKKYKKNIMITTRDYIDINSDIKVEDIMHFLAKPIPFCRYCDVKNRKSIGGWKHSTGDISEWT